MIFEVLSYSYFLSDASAFLYRVSKNIRRMVIENYFYILNTLIPDAFSIKEFFLSKNSKPQTITRFTVYNIHLEYDIE